MPIASIVPIVSTQIAPFTYEGRAISHIIFRVIREIIFNCFHAFVINKVAKSSKFLSPQQAAGYYGIMPLRGADFAYAWNPRSQLRGI